MEKILNKEMLEKIKAQRANRDEKSWIKVGFSSCGIAAGAADVFNVLVEEAKKRNAEIEIEKCGCAGKCYAEPLIEVNIPGMPRVFYGKVTKEMAQKIFEKHVCGKMLVNDCIYDVKD